MLVSLNHAVQKGELQYICTCTCTMLCTNTCVISYLQMHKMIMDKHLTFTPMLLLADIYIFGLSSGWLTNTVSCMCRELSISASTCGGADAVSARNGAFDKARNPPSLEKDSRKPLPLRQISSSIHMYIHVHVVVCECRV